MEISRACLVPRRRNRTSYKTTTHFHMPICSPLIYVLRLKKTWMQISQFTVTLTHMYIYTRMCFTYCIKLVRHHTIPNNNPIISIILSYCLEEKKNFFKLNHYWWWWVLFSVECEMRKSVVTLRELMSFKFTGTSA